MNDHFLDRITVRKIRKIVVAEDLASADKLLFDYDSKLYSIGEEKEDHMCLIKVNGQASVIYNGQVIAENVSLERAYIILYNYGRLLKEIIEFFQDNRKIMEKASIKKQDVVEVYLGIYKEENNEENNRL